MTEFDNERPTPERLKKQGYKPMSPMKAIRQRCLYCVGTAHEVARCSSPDCPIWPFRFGKSPWKKKRPQGTGGFKSRNGERQTAQVAVTGDKINGDHGS